MCLITDDELAGAAEEEEEETEEAAGQPSPLPAEQSQPQIPGRYRHYTICSQLLS